MEAAEYREPKLCSALGWPGRPGLADRRRRAIKRGYQDVYAGESHPHFMAPYAHTGGNADIISLSGWREHHTESSSES